MEGGMIRRRIEGGGGERGRKWRECLETVISDKSRSSGHVYVVDEENILCGGSGGACRGEEWWGTRWGRTDRAWDHQ